VEKQLVLEGHHQTPSNATADLVEWVACQPLIQEILNPNLSLEAGYTEKYFSVILSHS
jgi:hypothetical protein